MRKNRAIVPTKKTQKRPKDPTKKTIGSRITRKVQSYHRWLVAIPELIQSDDKDRAQSIHDFTMASLGRVENERQGRYADLIDAIPIIGDVANLVRLGREDPKYHGRIIGDFLLGAIPIVGDIADFLVGTDTNKTIIEERQRVSYYNSLRALGREDLAETYRLEMEKKGKSLNLEGNAYTKFYGAVTGVVVKGVSNIPVLKGQGGYANWEEKQVKKMSDTFGTYGFLGWRKLINKPRTGAKDKIKINPQASIAAMDTAVALLEDGERQNPAEYIREVRSSYKTTKEEIKTEQQLEKEALTTGNPVTDTPVKMVNIPKSTPASVLKPDTIKPDTITDVAIPTEKIDNEVPAVLRQQITLENESRSLLREVRRKLNE